MRRLNMLSTAHLCSYSLKTGAHCNTDFLDLKPHHKLEHPDDLEILSAQANADDVFFDSVIGHIEDIFMEENFQELQKCFMEKYWQEFEDNEENKLCYMDIFKEYTEIIEKHIETHLAKQIPNFSMDRFIEHLQARKDELDGEVFDVLFTFSDFTAFKEMFLDYKAVKDGRVEDLSKGICITSGILH